MGLVQIYLFSYILGGFITPYPFFSVEVKDHDFHTSLTEMNYNEENKSFEVSLRVFTDDLERALEKFNQGKKVNLDNSEKYDALIEKYVTTNFYVENNKKQLVPYTFYGKEIKAERTIIYMELAMKRNLKGHTLYNLILTEIFDDQFNIVNIFYRGKKKSCRFKRGLSAFEMGLIELN